MKRYFILTLFIAIRLSTSAQNRQDITGFSQFKQYLNPALTGYEGTSVQSFYRNQMASFENAPKTLFLSGEVNLSDIVGKSSDKFRHSFGLAVLQDAFGAIKDNRVNLSYSAAVKISSKLSLSAGVATTYNNVKIDAQEMTLAEQGDGAYLSLLNETGSMNKYGLNIGVALSSDNFYVGYALNDVFKISNGNQTFYDDVYVKQHIAKAGYRKAFIEEFGLVVNGVFKYDTNQKGIAEVQIKNVFLNTFWIGAGYRQDVAYTFNTGIRIKQFRLGYSRDLSTEKIGGIYRGGNEIVLNYNFNKSFGKSKKTLDIW